MSAYQYLLNSLSWSKHAETAEFNTSNVPEAISLCVLLYSQFIALMCVVIFPIHCYLVTPQVTTAHTC